MATASAALHAAIARTQSAYAGWAARCGDGDGGGGGRPNTSNGAAAAAAGGAGATESLVVVTASYAMTQLLALPGWASYRAITDK